MYFLFSGSEMDIESKDWLEIQASDRITLTVGSKTIVISQNGIHFDGDVNVTGNFHSNTIHASDMVGWNSKDGCTGGGSSGGGSTTFSIQQFQSDITIDPITTANPTIVVVVAGTPGDRVMISTDTGMQVFKIPASGAYAAQVNVPYMYPEGDVVYTFTVNDVAVTTRTLHVTMTSDPDAPDPNAATEFTVSGVPDSVNVYGQSNSYTGSLSISFTASPGSKIYTTVTWSKGSIGGVYPVTTDKHGVTSTNVSVSLPPGETEFTCLFTCSGYPDITQTVAINISDLQ